MDSVKTAAVVSMVVLAISIAVGNILGEMTSEVAWFLLVPVGMFGAGSVALVSGALLLRRRLR